MKNTNNHNRFLKRLVKNQVVVKSWNNEPANLRVTRSGIADAPSKFLMLCEKIGGIENGSTDTLRRFRIVGAIWWELGKSSKFLNCHRANKNSPLRPTLAVVLGSGFHHVLT